MSVNGWTLFVLVVAVLLVLVCWRQYIRQATSVDAWRPRELRDAELVYAEQVFRTEGTFPIVAILDRGYRNAKGVIILVELKTRHVNHPYRSDVIELSAQRLAVQMQTGECVAEYGYVLIQRPGSQVKFPHRVKLLSTEEVIALAKRRKLILRNSALARYTCSQGLCAKCTFAQECKSTIDPLA